MTETMNTPDCYKFGEPPKTYDAAAIRSNAVLADDEYAERIEQERRQREGLKICLLTILLEKLAYRKQRQRIAQVCAYLCKRGEIRRVRRGVYEKVD